jgi:predicted PurR-regulated permease PerM
MTDYQPQPTQQSNTTRNIIIAVVVIVLLCCCCLIATMVLMGPTIGNVFSNIIQNIEITPAP